MLWVNDELGTRMRRFCLYWPTYVTMDQLQFSRCTNFTRRFEWFLIHLSLNAALNVASDLRARRCWVTMSCSARISFPVPSLREGTSTTEIALRSATYTGNNVNFSLSKRCWIRSTTSWKCHSAESSNSFLWWRMRSEVYGSVFLCLCRLLQLVKNQWSANKSFYRLLVMFYWILICGLAK